LIAFGPFFIHFRSIFDVFWTISIVFLIVFDGF